MRNCFKHPFLRTAATLLVLNGSFSSCFKYQLVQPELQIQQDAIERDGKLPQAEFCALIGTQLNHMRAHTGRMQASAPPPIFYYAALCKEQQLLAEPAGAASEYSVEQLLVRAALCGNLEAVRKGLNDYHLQVSPLYSQTVDDGELYLEERAFFGTRAHPEFPGVEIRPDSFCGYAETRFTTVGVITTPFVLVPTLILGAPFLVIGGVVYAVTLGQVNLFR